MTTIQLTVELDKSIDQLLRPFERQKDFIASKALNDMADDLRKQMPKLIAPQIEGGPVAFTKRNWLRGKRATKKRLYIEVGPGRIQSDYLEPLVLGGPRDLKDIEVVGSYPRAVPSDYMKLNARGNVRRGTYLSVFKQARERGNGKYVIISFEEEEKGLPAGIYQRMGGQRRKNQRLRPLFFFVKQAVYKKSLNLKTPAERYVKKIQLGAFQRAAEFALRTSTRGRSL